jgi:predicted RNase H-like HicB family nuclease
MTKYAVIFEKTGTGYCAHSPDVPRCFTTGPTLEETKRLMKEALEFHFQGIREDGDPIPMPKTEAGYVEVEIPHLASSTRRHRKISVRRRSSTSTPSIPQADRI